MELDRVPLWSGDHVEIQQLVEHFARYLYLPRLQSSEVLLGAIRDGLAMVTWEQDSFAHAESYDEEAGRYRGLQFGRQIRIADASAPGLLVKPDVARNQIDSETKPTETPDVTPPELPGSGRGPAEPELPETKAPTRFHGSVDLDVARVGRDAGRIAEEVISHPGRARRRAGESNSRNRSRYSCWRVGQRRPNRYRKQPHPEVQEPRF